MANFVRRSGATVEYLELLMPKDKRIFVVRLTIFLTTVFFLFDRKVLDMNNTFSFFLGAATFRRMNF